MLKVLENGEKIRYLKISPGAGLIKKSHLKQQQQQQQWEKIDEINIKSLNFPKSMDTYSQIAKDHLKDLYQCTSSVSSKTFSITQRSYTIVERKKSRDQIHGLRIITHMVSK